MCWLCPLHCRYEGWGRDKFVSAKLKKSLVFAEIISDFLNLDEGEVHEDSVVDKHIFLISTTDPWYGILLFICKH